MGYRSTCLQHLPAVQVWASPLTSLCLGFSVMFLKKTHSSACVTGHLWRPNELKHVKLFLEPWSAHRSRAHLRSAGQVSLSEKQLQGNAARVLMTGSGSPEKRASV